MSANNLSVFEIFQTLPAKTHRLKYFEILLFWLFIQKISFKRSFLSNIEHSRIFYNSSYITAVIFRRLGDKGSNNLFVAVLLWIKNSNDLSQSSATMSTVKIKCSVCCRTDLTTKTANHLKPSEIILNQQKPSKATQKPPKCTCTNGTTHHPTAQRATRSYLVFLLLTLNIISQSGKQN